MYYNFLTAPNLTGKFIIFIFLLQYSAQWAYFD